MFDTIKDLKDNLRNTLPHSYKRHQVTWDTFRYLETVILYTNGKVKAYARRYYRLLKRKSEFHRMNVRFTCTC